MPPISFNNANQSTNTLSIPPQPSFDYNGDQADFTHNAYQDAQGNLLFFIVDSKIYNKDGYFIDFVGGDQNITGLTEVAIVPVPGECNKFYIITAAQLTGTWHPYLCMLDLDMTSSSYPYGSCVPPTSLSNNLYLDLASSSITTTGYLATFAINPYNHPGCSIAVAEGAPNNGYYVFIANGEEVFLYRLDASGITYMPTANFNGATKLAQGQGNYGIRCGMEVYRRTTPSSYEYVLAVPYDYAPLTTTTPEGDAIILYFYSISSNSVNVVHSAPLLFSNINTNNTNLVIPYLHGIEFSPDGRILYITHNSTNSPQPNYIAPVQFVYVGPTSIIPGLYSLNIPNATDYENSQIELGADGKLYFATTDHFGVVASPNSPSTTTFTTVPYGNSLTYAPNYASISTQDAYLKEYILPDQIDGFDYASSLFADTRCCYLYTYYDENNYDVKEELGAGTHTWQPGQGQNPWNSTSGTVYIRNRLIIPAGVDLTIRNMTFKFGPKAKVIVEDKGANSPNATRGGRLILDHSTFTANDMCSDTMWYGIRVMGNTAFDQIPYASTVQGQVTLNNSTVEDAYYAVVASDSVDVPPVLDAPAYTSYKGGGIIWANHSYFINNQYDIVFGPYQGNVVNANMSRFNQCHFVTNAPLNASLVFPENHVTMAVVKNINFYGCTFQNSDPNLYGIDNLSHRGSGIVCGYSGLHLLPSFNGVKCHFEGLDYGVQFNAWGISTIKADLCEFTDNHRAMWLKSAQNPVITNNTFDVGTTVNSSTNYNPVSYGLYLEQCNGYTIEENDFNTTTASSGTNFGSITRSSGPYTNEIYRNQFNNLAVACEALGQNDNTKLDWNGLEYLCNNFGGDSYDIALINGVISDRQGQLCATTTNDPYGQMPAGNTFDHCCPFPESELYADNSAILTPNPQPVWNAGQNYIYSTHNGSSPQTIPLYYSLYTPYYDLNNCAQTFISGSSPVSSCPAHLGTAGPGPINQLIVQKQADIAALKAMLDGGNSAALLAQVNNNTIPLKNLKNNLKQAWPLSSAVLKAMILRPFPTGGNDIKHHIKTMRDILKDNSPLSDDILLTLLNRTAPTGEEAEEEFTEMLTETAEENFPFSDALLIAYINHPSPLYSDNREDYEEELGEFLEDHTALSQQVLDTLLNRQPALPQDIISDILALQNNGPLQVSPRQASDGQLIEQQIAATGSRMIYQVNRLVSEWLLDTLNPHSLDSALLVMKQYNLPGSGFGCKAVKCYVNMRHYTKAQQQIDSLHPTGQLDYSCMIQQILIALGQQGKCCYALQNDTARQQTVRGIANDSAKYGCFDARALLSFIFNEKYDELIIYPSPASSNKYAGQGDEGRQQAGSLQKAQTALVNSAFAIYPSPASDQITVEANLKGTGHLYFYNVLGQPVKDMRLEAGYSNLKVPVSTWPAGVYVYVLSSDGLNQKGHLVVK